MMPIHELLLEQASPATMTACKSTRGNSFIESIRAPYSDGTARKQFTSWRAMAERAASTDKSDDNTSVPPLKRLQNVPATELSKAIDERSRNRGTGTSL